MASHLHKSRSGHRRNVAALVAAAVALLTMASCDDFLGILIGNQPPVISFGTFVTSHLKGLIPFRITEQFNNRTRKIGSFKLSHGRKSSFVDTAKHRQVIRHNRQSGSHCLTDKDTPSLLMAWREKYPSRFHLREVLNRRQESWLDTYLGRQSLLIDRLQKRRLSTHSPRKKQLGARPKTKNFFPNRQDISKPLVRANANHNSVERLFWRRNRFNQ